jgi:hypothetical protein
MIKTAIILLAAAKANRRICWRSLNISCELRRRDYFGSAPNGVLYCKDSREKTGRPPVFLFAFLLFDYVKIAFSWIYPYIPNRSIIIN